MKLIFQSNLSPAPHEWAHSLFFAFHQDKLLVIKKESSLCIPNHENIKLLEMSYSNELYIGNINGRYCYSADLIKDLSSDNIPANLSLINLSKLYSSVEDDLFWAAGRAYNIINWHRTHLFCGKCGASTQQKSDELAKVCPNCGLIVYPAMAPAIIVAIIKGNKILLARNKQKAYQHYSVLAGFVEPGETLHDCVKREIVEEVGIKVKNISYFGSQPWPFPNSLMIAFTAEYESGEIKVDGKEISDAGWFAKDELPIIPGSISVSWHLIEWFKQQ